MAARALKPGREIHCRRTVNDGKDHCPWSGTVDEFPDHTAETDEAGDPHEACVVCHQSLADDETQVCTRCVKHVDDELAEILDLYATLPDAVERGALHTGRLPGGNALVLLADGSIDGGGPDDHVRYHDPVLVLATLHDLWECDWRGMFRHDHFPRWQATVATTIGYLRKWLRTAARQHPSFEDFAGDVHTLHLQLARTVGRSDDPASANADCTRCGGRLRRNYRNTIRDRDQRRTQAETLIADLWTRALKQRDALRSYGIDESELTPLPNPTQERALLESVMRGHASEGLNDTAVCADCGHQYTSGEYRIALRVKALANASGWITPAAAASLLERPQQTIWRWIREMEIASACRLTDQRIVVETDELRKRDARAGRRKHGELHSCA